MKLPQEIFQALMEAPSLEKAVAALSDKDLRSVRGALAQGDICSWPADLVHGCCIVEGSERFMNQEACDKCHGSEVRQ